MARLSHVQASSSSSTLDEALAGGLRIRETSESGSVPEPAVENLLAERVLLYDGEELIGAKQNRILNVSVLVEAKSSLTIPVSCVEQGAGGASRSTSRPRRTSRTRSSGVAGGDAGLLPARARRRADRGLGGGARQGAAHVGALVDGREPRHPPRLRADVRALEGAFPAQPGQWRRARDRRVALPRPRLATGCVRAARPKLRAGCSSSTRSSAWKGRRARARTSTRSWLRPVER